MANSAWSDSTAWSDCVESVGVRPAICVRHPTSNQKKQEIFFCFDCNRVFCTYCQLVVDNRTNHLPHRTIKMSELMRIRTERIAKIRQQIKEYNVKHDSTISEMNKSIAIKQNQIQMLDDVIDQFSYRLHQKVEDLNVKAKELIKNKASFIWEKSPITSIQHEAEVTLANLNEVRDSLEYEIQRCEMDELTMAERSKEMDALSDQLETFLQSQIQLPTSAAFDLSALCTQLLDYIEHLELEVSHSTEAFVRKLDSSVMFPNPDSVRLVEQEAVPAQKLVLPSDQNQTSWVSGVAQDEDSDIVYITDEKNPSRIKSLNLKTHRIAEVFTSSQDNMLRGLFVLSDRPNRSFIVTTEQTSSPVSIRAHFLRCNAFGQLSLVQTVTLQESKSSWSSFATGPNRSVFCAINGSSSVHEISRTQGAANAPFGAAAKAHRLPDSIRSICGFHCSGEQRIAVSFTSNSVRVFRATGGELFELHQIAAPHADWSPGSLVGLADGTLTGAFCISSYLADSEGKYDIDFCAADASGAFSTPRRLIQCANRVELRCHLRAEEASENALRIVAVEDHPRSFLTTASLRVFLLQQD